MRAFVLAVLLALPVLADDTVTVYGHGTAPVRPDSVELRFRVAAKAEKAADALTKIAEKSGKVKDAMELVVKERKLAASAVKDSGLEFRNALDADDAGVVFGGGAAEPPPGEVLIETQLSLTVEEIGAMKDVEVAEHISEVIDGVIAAGGVYSGGFQWDWSGQRAVPASVVFRVKDSEAARAAAIDAAVAEAKARAAAIARRFGREVGDVVHVEDLGSKPAEKTEPVPGEFVEQMLEWRQTGGSEIQADFKVEFRLK